MKKAIAAATIAALSLVTIAGPASALNDTGGGGSRCVKGYYSPAFPRPIFVCLQWASR